MRKLLAMTLMLLMFSFIEIGSRAGEVAAARTTQSGLESYVGKYPSDLFKGVPGLKRKLKVLLGVNYNFFMTRLQVQMPIENVDGALVARGCMAHSCGIEEAILAINLTDGKMHCGILSDKYGHKLKIFSEDKTHLPRVLKRLPE
jgi:hypothetical protein